MRDVEFAGSSVLALAMSVLIYGIYFAIFVAGIVTFWFDLKVMYNLAHLLWRAGQMRVHYDISGLSGNLAIADVFFSDAFRPR